MSVYSQIIHLSERLNRAGETLTEEETDWLEQALRLEAAAEKRSRNRGGAIRPWQRSDIRKLKQFLRMGRKVPEFAPILGRTSPAVHRKMRKLGLRCGQGSVALSEAAE